jgi:hypothetical protein
MLYLDYWRPAGECPNISGLLQERRGPSSVVIEVCKPPREAAGVTFPPRCIGM